MKRFLLSAIIVCLMICIGAEEFKIGTIKGTQAYGPLFTKVLKEIGLDVAIISYDTQPAIFEALAKRQIDAAYFIAQPIIAQINGAIMVPVRLSQTDFYAVTTDPSIKVRNPGDLRKYTVGIVKDNMAHAAITRGVTTTVCQSDGEQYTRLGAGHFQVAISIDKLIPILSKATGIGPCYLSERPLLSSPTFLALSGSQGRNKTKIETVLKEWQSSGKWEAEMQKIE